MLHMYYCNPLTLKAGCWCLLGKLRKEEMVPHANAFGEKVCFGQLVVRWVMHHPSLSPLKAAGEEQNFGTKLRTKIRYTLTTNMFVVRLKGQEWHIIPDLVLLSCPLKKGTFD